MSPSWNWDSAIPSPAGEFAPQITYIEYHSVCPLVGIGTPPCTSSAASECAPPPGTNGRGGGHTRLLVRGWRSPNSDDLRKSSALCLLCGQRQTEDFLNLLRLSSCCRSFICRSTVKTYNYAYIILFQSGLQTDMQGFGFLMRITRSDFLYM